MCHMIISQGTEICEILFVKLLTGADTRLSLGLFRPLVTRSYQLYTNPLLLPGFSPDSVERFQKKHLGKTFFTN